MKGPHLTFENIDQCPGCGDGTRTRWHRKKQKLPTFSCSKCGMIYMGKRLTEESLSIYYTGYSERRDSNDPELMRQRRKMYEIDRRFVLSFITSGTFLDFGCASGDFINGFSPKIRKFGYDIDSAAIFKGKTQHPDVRFLNSLDAIKRIPKIDSVIFRGTIQYQRNLSSTLSFILPRIRNGGYVFLLATPNANSPAAIVQRQNWSLHRELEHLFHLSPTTLPIVFREFKVESIDFPYFNTPYESHTRDLEAFIRVCRNPSAKVRFPFWGSMMNVALRKK